MRASLIRTMSRTPCSSSFLGIGSMPHSGMPGPPRGPALRRTRTESGVTSNVWVVDAGVHVVVVLEDDRGASVGQQVWRRRGVLDDGSVGGEGAVEDRQAALLVHRVAQRADHVVVVDRRALQRLVERVAGDGRDVVQVKLGHEGAESAGLEEVLHQVLAARAQVGEHRDFAGELVEAAHRHVYSGSAGHGDQVDDRVGGAAQRQHDLDRVLEGLQRERRRRQRDDAAARRDRHARVIAVRGRDGRGARQGQAQRLDRGGHGRGRAHRHAVAGRRGDPFLGGGPVLLGDRARPQLVPVLPHVANPSPASGRARTRATSGRPGRR